MITRLAVIWHHFHARTDAVTDLSSVDPPEPARRYPTNRMPMAAELPVRDERFDELREEFLVDYTYNTARAYWSDLEQIYDWAIERGKDTLTLTDKDITQYCALLRRRKYSENTVRRRQVVWRRFRRLCNTSTHPDVGSPGPTS